MPVNLGPGTYYLSWSSTYPVTANNLASVNVKAEHVARVEEREVLADRVHPDQMVELGVSDTDVP